VNPALSLLVSGIRNDNWNNVYKQMMLSCDRHDFEIVFVSPYPLPKGMEKLNNVQYSQDFGCPSRCLQKASTLARGKYIAAASDDVIINEKEFSNCIDLLEQNDSEKDIIALKYTEGQGFNANEDDFEPNYWNAHHHASLRMPGIHPGWKICLMFMMNVERFRGLGGLDCRFEHFNLNLHDFAFRAQRTGSKVITSVNFVTKHDWEPGRDQNNSPIIAAYHQNDLPLFNSIYSQVFTSYHRPVCIRYDNWMRQPEKWARRFG